MKTRPSDRLAIDFGSSGFDEIFRAFAEYRLRESIQSLIPEDSSLLISVRTPKSLVQSVVFTACIKTPGLASVHITQNSDDYWSGLDDLIKRLEQFFAQPDATATALAIASSVRNQFSNPTGR